MKIYFFFSLVAIFALTSGVFVPPRPGHKKHNLGAEECTWGPDYWCKNLTAAAGCHAVRHCIDTVWVYQKLPPDTSSVCQICLDMVKQARDNLESNETQDLIKQVFEGSCKLIHLKPIVKECDRIADEFIPELIDTLASQMNPQVVCSVAGLCNNQRVDELLAEESFTKVAPVDHPNQCNGCHNVVNILEENFNKMTKDEVLHSFLWYCGKFGSFSDSCSNIVITYFTEIYNHLQEHLNPNEICLLSGECSAQFHKHEAKVEITPMSHIGYVPVNTVKDDLPCDLCEQLVKHLKDLLIANTTELEFKQVFEGFCKQTGKFSEECVSIVDQYYSEIYDYLVNRLNSKEVCTDIGICNATTKEGGLIAPLLPFETSKVATSLSSNQKTPLVHVKLNQDASSVRILPNPQQQLPLDLLMPPHTQILYNKEVCIFCQYFLHEVQVAITDPMTEENIKEVIDKACNKLPPYVNSTCMQFVDSYEPALVALLAQEIDPSQICPLIRACPSSESKDVEIFMEAKGNTECPLCLLAVTKLEDMVKSVKTKENIENALDQLCLDLPSNMVPECKEFVNTYTEELVELIISDLKPDEVCVFLKLCQDDKPASQLPQFVIKHLGGNIETNVIPDNTINGQIIGIEEPVVQDKPQCVICQFVMKEIEEKLKDKKTDDDIENIVKNICKIMPSSVKSQCNGLVDKYGDLIIQLLISSLEPKEICTRINLCSSSVEIIRGPSRIPDYTPIDHGVSLDKPVEQDGPQCVVCQFVMKEIQDQLKNNKTDEEIENIVRDVCRVMPTSIKTQCDSVIEEYGDAIIQLLIAALEPDEICSMIKLCTSYLETVRVKILECPICEMTVEVMEKILHNPRADHAVEHVLEKTCRGLPIQYRSKCKLIIEKHGKEIISLIIKHVTPHKICAQFGLCSSEITKDDPQLGVHPCTYGPTYWCQNEKNADECHARSHCETRVWLRPKPNKTRLLGADHCSRGPGYWCQNEETANECGFGARSHCEKRVWLGVKPNITKLLGADHCSRGPGYWCQNEETANECGNGARSHCQSTVWLGQKPNNTKLIGANHCSRGPGYWCQSEKTANECGFGAKSHCQTKVWFGAKPNEQRFVGVDHCTRGPGYWCQSEETANECGDRAREFCKAFWDHLRSKRGSLEDEVVEVRPGASTGMNPSAHKPK